jgi:23S rRNA (adenine2030-N6)-methyltransferase
MNYRHAYHAGNHADVLKHAVLALALEHLKKKEKPLFFLDAHAGVGTYALASEQALKTLEWQDGLGRLFDLSGAPIVLAENAEKLIAPWRETVTAINGKGSGLSHYPGSPEFARQHLRQTDRMILNELHPIDHRALAAYAATDKRMRVTRQDASVAIKAHLPPPERRGLILIDPPYEREDEGPAAVEMLRSGLKRFATGVLVLWYPVTGDGLNERIVADVKALGIPKTWQAELRVRGVVAEGGLAGSGLLIVNPPWPLEEELGILLAGLFLRLAQSDEASFSLEPMN